jgi:methanogenic corrinoid protein MtbC1
MAEIGDISNEFIRQEIEEYIERPEERERTINTFSKSRPAMQAIAAALIEGDNEIVDQLTRQALDSGIEALEVMDYGLIAGMGIVGIKFRPGLRPSHEGGQGLHRAHSIGFRS